MTTIGTAVLQIIPSLLGVTEAIEKQIDGKVVEVKIEPKVDKTATQKAGKDAGATITKEVKDAVRKGDIGKTVGDEVKTSVKKTSAGKEVAKIIVDGVADGVKQELRDGSVGEAIVDGVAEGVKQGIDGEGLGGQVVDAISGGIKAGNLGATIKDAVLPGITEIGSQLQAGAAEWSSGIADSLRSGDIQGATADISAVVLNTTNTIAGIGDAFGIETQEIQDFGGGLADAIQRVGDTAGDTKIQVDSIITPLQTLGELAGPESKLYKAAGQLPLVGQIAVLLPAMRDANAELESMVNKYTGLNVPLSGESWVRWLTDNGDAFTSAEGRARQMLADAQAAAAANGPPPRAGGGLGRAGGGVIPGFSTTDDRLGLVGGRGLIGLAGGEGIINANSTRNLGGAPFINWLNGFAEGGVVPPDVAAAQALVGTPYSQAKRNDCSGTVAQIINRTLGMGGGLMSTKTASEWLKERGFKPGPGGPGQISVGWYDHGPNPNDGHMAMTLSDGRNAEAGGSSGPFTIGGAAAGANHPQFDQQMHLPTVYGEGPAGPSSASPFAVGSAAAAASAAPPVSSGGGSSAGGGWGGINFPSTLPGLAGFGLADLKGPETGPGNRQFEYGKALDAAVTGQVASALDVFGVPSSPGWLKGISQFVSGISISGGGGSSADPLAAFPNATGTPAPGDAANMHGSRAGQQPGVTYNITARDTEDAFVRAQRKERERAAAKLSRF
jgi:hypothetical protein